MAAPPVQAWAPALDWAVVRPASSWVLPFAPPMPVSPQVMAQVVVPALIRASARERQPAAARALPVVQVQVVQVQEARAKPASARRPMAATPVQAARTVPPSARYQPIAEWPRSCARARPHLVSSPTHQADHSRAPAFAQPSRSARLRPPARSTWLRRAAEPKDPARGPERQARSASRCGREDVAQHPAIEHIAEVALSDRTSELLILARRGCHEIAQGYGAAS